MNFHSLFLGIGLLTLAATLVSLRREHIRAEYSVNWLLVGLILTLLAASPRIMDIAARRFGLDPGLFFLLAGGALISGLVFEISHVVSKLRDENVMLAQRLAILEYRLQHTIARHGEDSQ
jgi:hypothetical protein